MWIAPPPAPDDEAALRGTLGGARLFEQPAHRAKVDALMAFLDAPGPVCLEVGVDYGTAHVRAMARGSGFYSALSVGAADWSRSFSRL